MGGVLLGCWWENGRGAGVGCWCVKRRATAGGLVHEWEGYWWKGGGRMGGMLVGVLVCDMERCLRG
jgi:hypothetical protein